jgi:hypothetical protein
MMTYGSSNYRIVFMFKQNSKSDGDDQIAKANQIVCQSFMKISLLSTPSAEIKLPFG